MTACYPKEFQTPEKAQSRVLKVNQLYIDIVNQGFHKFSILQIRPNQGDFQEEEDTPRSTRFKHRDNEEYMKDSKYKTQAFECLSGDHSIANLGNIDAKICQMNAQMIANLTK